MPDIIDNSHEKQALMEKWEPALNAEGEYKILDNHKRYVTARLLENEAQALTESANNVTSSIQTYDPVLIKMVRRTAPVLIAYDMCGVQPMSLPTGLAFAMKARYDGGNVANPEALFDEANTAHSGTGTHEGSDPFGVAAFTTGTALDTPAGEAATAWNEMGMTIEKVPVVAKTRQLKSTYSIELAQDLKAVHGMDAESELTNILSNEVIAETNREIVRTIYAIAKPGAQYATTPGEFDLYTDSDGRWSVERVKGLIIGIEKEANAIARETRRGKGNFIITSSDVASALHLAGVLDYAPALSQMNNMDIDAAGVSYAGNFGRFKVYVDPYLSGDGIVVGYKGIGSYDAGLIYSPYVPATLYNTTDPKTFQPALGIKSRYAVTANPMTTMTVNENVYYRKFAVKNLL